MFCQHCGNQLPDNAKFCDQCGTPTHVNSAPAGNASGRSFAGFRHKHVLARNTASGSNPGTRRKRKFIPTLATVLVLLLAVSCMDSDSSSSSSSSSGSGSSKSSKSSSTKTVAEIPDPDKFFDLDCTVKEDSDDNGTIVYTITSDKDHLHILEEYLDLLTDAYPFRKTDSEHVTETYVQIDPEHLYDYLYGLNYKGDEDLEYTSYQTLESGRGYDIYIQHRGTGTRYTKGQTVEWKESSTIITIRNANQFEVVSAGNRHSPVSEPGQAEKTLTSVLGKLPSADSTLLPDIGAYLGLSTDQTGKTAFSDHGRSSSYGVISRGSDGEEIIEEILALLQDERYQLELTDTAYEDYTKYSSSDYTYYIFRYKGSSDAITSIHYDNYSSFSYEVYLLVHREYSANTIALDLSYDEDFIFEDPGVRTSLQVVSVSGNSTNNDSNYVVEYGNALECTVCNGNGDCTKCHGAIGGCSSCYLSGNCQKCNGTGKRYP